MCVYVIELKEGEVSLSTIDEVKDYAIKNLNGSYDTHMNFKQVQRELETNGYFLEVEN